jgi:hypothetical protein
MPHFQQGIEVYNMDNIIWGLDKGEMRLEQLEAAPLYSAALCELSDTIEKLIGEHPEQVNARGGTKLLFFLKPIYILEYMSKTKPGHNYELLQYMRRLNHGSYTNSSITESCK